MTSAGSAGTKEQTPPVENTAKPAEGDAKPTEDTAQPAATPPEEPKKKPVKSG